MDKPQHRRRWYELFSGVPRSWGARSRELTDTAKNNIKSGISKISGFTKIYLQNDPYPLFKIFVEEIENPYPPEDVSVINFPSYFSSKTSGDEEETKILPVRKLTFVINIGDEPAVNLKFSRKLLLGLIDEAAAINGIIVLVSEMPYSSFESKYEISIASKLRLPWKKEENIFS